MAVDSFVDEFLQENPVLFLIFSQLRAELSTFPQSPKLSFHGPVLPFSFLIVCAKMDSQYRLRTLSGVPAAACNTNVAKQRHNERGNR